MQRWAHTAPWLLVLVANIGVAAGDIHVKKGETWRVTPAQASLNLDSLTLEEGARIEFAPEVHLWQLSADVVRIGENVIIDAHGTHGAEGAAGVVAVPASACQNGAAGGNGAAGAAGEDGVTLALTLGVQQLGSLHIDTRGGNGGNGGHGAPGQAAGELDDCELAHGGEGGDGGRGGDGGNGGQVRLSLALKAPNLSLDFLRQRLTLDSAGGLAGAPGKGASGGEGSPGRWLSMKTLTGDKKFVAGGQAGKNGKDGSPGQAGRPGVSDIGEDIRQRVDAMIEAGNRQMETLAADLSGQKSTLAEQVAQLQQNVTALQTLTAALQAEVKALQAQLRAGQKAGATVQPNAAVPRAP